VRRGANFTLFQARILGACDENRYRGYGGFVNKKQQVQWSMLGVIGVEGAWQKGERILYALGKNISWNQLTINAFLIAKKLLASELRAEALVGCRRGGTNDSQGSLLI